MKLEMHARFGTIALLMKTPQSAAIPYRRNAAGELEVLLVTSRRSGRWVLPKGNINRMLPHAAAAREAFEEAGVLGVIRHTPVGDYLQQKILADGHALDIAVSAYPLFVNVLLGKYPEMDLRKRKWMHVLEAADAVKDRELGTLLQSFAEAYDQGDPDEMPKA